MAYIFDFQERLGAGHFGEVWLAIDPSLDTTRAVKIIPQEKLVNPNNFFYEAQILKSVEHANIVKVEEAGILSDGRVYVAMEYLPKGSLEDETRGAYVDLTRAKRIMIDVLRGLEHAHEKGILHRDIKPGNILIGEIGEGKLSDFGLAMPVDINPKTLGIREYNYLLHKAPELFANNPYTFSSDIYACGVTMYRLVNGDSYLQPDPIITIVNRIKDENFPDRSRYREFIPRSLKLIINKAMRPSPTERYQSAREMRRALENINLCMNWKERLLPNGLKWICSWDNICYEVTRERNQDQKWQVTVRKGKSKESLRRISDLCISNTTMKNAESHTRRVLQDFVIGKLK